MCEIPKQGRRTGSGKALCHENESRSTSEGAFCCKKRRNDAWESPGTAAWRRVLGSCQERVHGERCLGAAGNSSMTQSCLGVVGNGCMAQRCLAIVRNGCMAQRRLKDVCSKEAFCRESFFFTSVRFLFLRQRGFLLGRTLKIWYNDFINRLFGVAAKRESLNHSVAAWGYGIMDVLIALCMTA